MRFPILIPCLVLFVFGILFDVMETQSVLRAWVLSDLCLTLCSYGFAFLVMKTEGEVRTLNILFLVSNLGFLGHCLFQLFSLAKHL
jgi:hypothetical protein